MCLDYLKINQRGYYNLPNSAFTGCFSMESQPQKPEFRINPEIFHPCSENVSVLYFDTVYQYIFNN